MSLTLEPLPPRSSAVDSCADALRRAIVGGDLAAGARLPPERTLAGQFGVNRVTVRSALARLARERLLTVRQGSGYVVQDYRRHAGPDLIAELAAIASARGSVAVAEDLLLVRRSLARAVLERLAKGVTATARKQVRDAVERLADLVVKHASADDLARADAEVLAAVVEATGSAVLQLCLNPLVALLAAVPALRGAVYADAADSVVAWRGLMGWLERPDVRTVPALIDVLAARDAQTIQRLSRGSRSKR